MMSKAEQSTSQPRDMPEQSSVKKRGRNNMPAGPGRPKGIPNKTTKTAKEAIALAAEKLGGADRLVAWAQEEPQNERVFWGTIYPKLLPLQVTGQDGDAIKTESTLNLGNVSTEVLAAIMKARDASESS